MPSYNNWQCPSGKYKIGETSIGNEKVYALYGGCYTSSDLEDNIITINVAYKINNNDNYSGGKSLNNNYSLGTVTYSVDDPSVFEIIESDKTKVKLRALKINVSTNLNLHFKYSGYEYTDSMSIYIPNTNSNPN